MRLMDELVIEDVKTTACFHQRLLAHEDFRMGRVHMCRRSFSRVSNILDPEPMKTSLP